MVASPMLMMVVVMMLVEEEQANEVDAEAQERDDEQALCLNLLRLEDSLDGFTEDIEGDEDQEYPVE